MGNVFGTPLVAPAYEGKPPKALSSQTSSFYPKALILHHMHMASSVSYFVKRDPREIIAEKTDPQKVEERKLGIISLQGQWKGNKKLLNVWHRSELGISACLASESV